MAVELLGVWGTREKLKRFYLPPETGLTQVVGKVGRVIERTRKTMGRIVITRDIVEGLC